MASILIAEDDEIVNEVVYKVFHRYGHAVGVLRNGIDLLEAISNKTPDLVILDCNMPDLPGIPTLRRIRASPIFFSLPVLMLTARTSDADMKIAMHEGANAYMRKPFDPDDLVFRVEDILSNRTTGRGQG